jgi:hypothetical protein
VYLCTEAGCKRVLALSADDLPRRLCVFTQVAYEWRSIVDELNAFGGSASEERPDRLWGYVAKASVHYRQIDALRCRDSRVDSIDFV